MQGCCGLIVISFLGRGLLIMPTIRDYRLLQPGYNGVFGAAFAKQVPGAGPTV